MNIRNILNSQQSGIKTATLVIVFSILVSRVLGLLRDRLLAGYFGASVDLDIYFAAFRIPDLIYSIIFAGGITVSFLPIFADYFKSKKEEAFKIVNYVLNIFIVLYFLFFFVFLAFTPEIISYLVPGLGIEAQAQAVNLTRIIFASVFFFGASSVFSMVLNYFNRFLAYSLAPILYNLGIILGIVFLSPHYGIYGAALGVVFGALLHFLVQAPGVFASGYSYRFNISFTHKAVKQFFSILFPRIIASAASQINFVVATVIASTIGAGAISIFTFSNNIRYLPIGVIGVSFATAVFPMLSKFWTEKNREAFIAKFKSVFLNVLYFSFPVGILIFILRNQIIRILLETGAFTLKDSEITAACLGLYFISTFAQCLDPILLRGFFALKDSKTPAIVCIFFMFFNVVLSFSLVNVFSQANFFTFFIKGLLGLDGSFNFPVIGLTLAFNISLLGEFLLFFYLFHKKMGDLGTKEMLSSGVKILMSSLVMIIFANYSLAYAEQIFSHGLKGLILQFGFVTIVSFIVYFVVSLLLKSKEAISIKENYLKWR